MLDMGRAERLCTSLAGGRGSEICAQFRKWARVTPPSEILLRPEPSRVVLRPFIPAEDGGTPIAGRPRVERILDRVLNLSQVELDHELHRVLSSLTDRHRDVEQVLQRRFF
jgi:hypothetical protein